MQRQALWNRLYLSGIDGRAADLARENGLGLEIAAFCYAPNLEDPGVRVALGLGPGIKVLQAVRRPGGYGGASPLLAPRPLCRALPLRH